MVTRVLTCILIGVLVILATSCGSRNDVRTSGAEVEMGASASLNVKLYFVSAIDRERLNSAVLRAPNVEAAGARVTQLLHELPQPTPRYSGGTHYFASAVAFLEEMGEVRSESEAFLEALSLGHADMFDLIEVSADRRARWSDQATRLERFFHGDGPSTDPAARHQLEEALATLEMIFAPTDREKGLLVQY
jgi:hypothetical protein